jgi:hypothetical protein
MAAPQIIIREKIVETETLAPEGMKFYLVATANWGKLETPQRVYSDKAFKFLYGTKTNNSILYKAVEKLLKYTNQIFITRVADGTEKKSNIKIEDITDPQNPTEIGTIEALYAGEYGNNIVVEFVDTGAKEDNWTLYNINVYVEGQLKEIYKLVNFNPDSNSYIEKSNLINGVSSFITIDITANLNSDPKIIETGNNIQLQLSGGINGDENVNAIKSKIATILDMFKNKEKYDIDIILVPDYSFDNLIETKLNELVSHRNDCISLIDPPQQIGETGTPTQIIDNIIKFTNGQYGSNVLNLNNKNLAVFAFWIKEYDETDKIYKWFPPSIYVAQRIAYLKQNSEIWDAVAGLRNGRIQEAVEVQYSPSQEERNILYGEQIDGKINVVNPIVQFPVEGVTIWGNRTTERSNNATSRLNVVLMLNYVKKELYKIARDFQFRLNTPDLDNEFISVTSNFLSTVRNRKGISDFAVITENTPLTRANFLFIAKIQIVPIFLTETIEITLEVNPTEITIK